MTNGYKKKGNEVDIDKTVSDVIVGKLKAGQIPWLSPHRSNDFREFSSPATDLPFKGVNRILLWITKQENQLQSNGFITLNQAATASGIDAQKMKDVRDYSKKEVTLESINHPLAGQNPVGFAVFSNPVYKRKDGSLWSKKEADGRIRKVPNKDDYKQDEISKEWVSRSYQLWSLDQLSFTPELWRQKREAAVMDDAQKSLGDTQDSRLRIAVQGLIRKNDIRVVTGESPDYDRDRDVILMPKIDSFVSDSSFYRSLLHQIVHWTGHQDRLNRKFDKFYGDSTSVQSVAQEELVAELGTAFLCQKLGIDSFTSSNLEYHESMTRAWVGLIEENPKVITFASSQAEKALNYLSISLERNLSNENKSTEPREP